MYIFICICIYIYIFICIYKYVYIYIYIHISIYIYIYIHLYIIHILCMYINIYNQKSTKILLRHSLNWFINQCINAILLANSLKM